MKPFIALFLVCGALLQHASADEGLQRVPYNNPGLVVDLGVGLWSWPVPMDFDGDGDNDLVVVSPDKPYNGTYFFENTSGDVKFPVFKPGVRISKGVQNVQVSYVDGKPRVLTAGREYHEFSKRGLEASESISVRFSHKGKVRASQWKYVDYDGDGDQDVAIGIGDWGEYGWDDAYNKQGKWTNGPLRGFVYLVTNTGSDEKPDYSKSEKLTAGGKTIDVYGRPSPSFADFDGDGDLDIVCGEFLDRFTYFQNVGTRNQPKYAAGRFLSSHGKRLAMDLQMISPVAFDWDKDGDQDLIVGDEDGRVALVEHTGKIKNGMPQFLPPRYFQQQAADVKFGALATPCGFDWDGDGDDDIICGNTAGYVSFIENLGGTPIKWNAPRSLKADGKVLRILAGPNGSIQGPCEAKWGYTTQTVGDWDHDGLPDLMVNSIWGKVEWYKNIGTRQKPKLSAARPVEVAWKGASPKPEWFWWNPKGNELVTQWRTTPVLVDWNKDELTDLVMLDHEGYLALFERREQGGALQLLPGKRIFVNEKGDPLRLNTGYAGKSGRRKLAVVDWDGDGKLDFLLNSENATWLRQAESREGKVVLKDMGLLDSRNVAGHTSSPTVVDWNRDGVPELLVGAEDGYFYHVQRKKPVK